MRAAAIALVVSASLRAAGQDPWLKITSANFELYTTAGERTGRDLVKHFEQVRSFFVQAFGSKLSGAKPARIIAFRNEKEYQAYRPNEFATAYYQPGSEHDFIVMSSGSSEHYPVAVHEFTHLMIHQSGMEIPPWLNEGLAELYSNMEPRGSKILVGQIIPGRLHVLRTDRWIPLATLLNVDHTSPYYNEKSRAGMFYAESWALVHLLSLTPEFRPNLSTLAKALKDGAPEAAFQKTYGKPLAEIEASLRAYFTGNTIREAVFNVQLPKDIDAPEIQTEAQMGARLALAEMMGNTRGKQEKAREAYQELAKEYPKSWEVAAGEADLAWRQRKLEDAAARYARAMELGCNDIAALLQYARVLGYLRRDADAAAVLRKTSAQFPQSDEAALELGATLVRTGNYGSAVAALAGVKRVTTAEQAYTLFYNLGYASYRLGDLERAKENAAKARGYTRNPAQIASLDRLAAAAESPARAGASVIEDNTGAPRMMRRADVVERKEEVVAHAPKLPSVEGALENMECGTLARLHVRVDGALRVFLIPDPSKVAIGSGSGATVEMQCGVQKPPKPLRIEYQEIAAGQALVRVLEFK